MRLLLWFILISTLILSPIFADSNQIAENSKRVEQQKETEFTRWGYGNEFLGAGHFWSFLGLYRPHENWFFSGGFSYILIPGRSYNADFFLFPVAASYLIGGFGHSMEIYVGTLISIPAEMGYRTADRKGLRASSTSHALTPQVGLGYAWFPRNEGWFFRATGYAIYGEDPIKKIYNVLYWGGLSLGRMF